MRLLLALRCFFLVLFAGKLPDEAQRLLPAPAPTPTGPSEAERRAEQAREQAEARAKAAEGKAQDAVVAAEAARGEGARRGAVHLLALLQREARLIDFLEEDIASYADAQVGAAVRDIHKGCRKALAEHVGVQAIRTEADGATVTIERGFDASRIKLVGNVVGDPPFRGALRHPGWCAARLQLADLPPSQDPTVIAPAEVELP